jgi:hypothetical protein
MCEGTLLPHCGHLLSCEACQRFAAFRVRNRIFDVLRFGTPMTGAYQSIIHRNYNQRLRDSLTVEALNRGRFDGSAIELQFIQRAPIRFPLCILLFGFELFGLTNPTTFSVAVRMCR